MIGGKNPQIAGRISNMKMKLAWLTDIHLDFLESPQREEFFTSLKSRKMDTALISGDIGTSHNLVNLLREIDRELPIPVHFVLGNHDFYHSSISEVRAAMKMLCIASDRLHYLTASGVVRLSEKTTLIGHDSWADGRIGDYELSRVMLNDYFLIEDLRDLSKTERLSVMKALADEAASYLKINLSKALEISQTVILLTHVPPFREACWHEGEISGPDYLPHFSCKAVGDVILDIMKERPDKKLIVLCGHTHSSGEVRILKNLTAYTGGAVYGAPKIQRIFKFP
jgi:Icc-related predicted phosphoesterase